MPATVSKALDQRTRNAASILLLMFLALHSGSTEAAQAADPGFWSGLGDGFLGLVTFLISPLLEVAVFHPDNATNGLYLLGYYLGAIIFAFGAGTAARGK